MRAQAFWRAVTMDHAGLIDQMLRRLADEGADYRVIGGQAVNAYVEPLVSLDLDLVVATAGR